MDKNSISLTLKCPICNHSLMDYSKLIRGEPSVRLLVKSGKNLGILYLCSVYGYYDKYSNIDLADGEIVELICPVCTSNLTSKSICDICNAPVFILRLVTQGKLHACSRVNCKKHKVIFEDIYENMTKYFTAHDYRNR